MTRSTSLARLGVYRSMLQHSPEGRFDSIVLGTGIAGMTVGAALGKTGQRVLLLEQHFTPGGMTQCFTRHGYRWDAGVHCLGEQGEHDVAGKLVRWLTDGALQMHRLPEMFERFHFPGDYEITYAADAEHFREQLIDAFPHEEGGLRRYFRLIPRVFDVARPFYALKATPLAFNRLAGATCGWLWRRSWSRTTRDVMNELFQDERLKSVLSAQWGYHGSPPSRSSFGMHAMLAKHFFEGAYYPIGGAESFARHFLETVRRCGGETYVRAVVGGITFDGDRATGVELADGRRFEAKRVVSAIGARNTLRLLPARCRDTNWARSIDSVTTSPAYLCLNLGFDGDVRAAGASETNRWLMESWDVENATWDLSDPASVPPIAYVSFPSLKDPSLAEEGPVRHTGEALAFVRWDAFERWKDTRWGRRGEAYGAFKTEIEERFVAHLRRRLPAIMARLAYHEMSTPVTTLHFTRSWTGSMYGFESTPARFENPNLCARTPYEGLFLSGADVVAPGVAGALVSGAITAASISPRLFRRLL